MQQLSVGGLLPAPRQHKVLKPALLTQQAEQDQNLVYHQHLHPQLTLQMCLLQGDLQVEVAVQNDGSGHPQIASVGRASMHFEDVDVQTFDAKLAWLYNLVLR